MKVKVVFTYKIIVKLNNSLKKLLRSRDELLVKIILIVLTKCNYNNKSDIGNIYPIRHTAILKRSLLYIILYTY